MTLGDIFEKVGRVSFSTIMSVWGWIAVVTMGLVFLTGLIFLVTLLLTAIFSVVPWWVIVLSFFWGIGLWHWTNERKPTDYDLLP